MEITTEQIEHIVTMAFDTAPEGVHAVSYAAGIRAALRCTAIVLDCEMAQ